MGQNKMFVTRKTFGMRIFRIIINYLKNEFLEFFRKNLDILTLWMISPKQRMHAYTHGPGLGPAKPGFQSTSRIHSVAEYCVCVCALRSSGTIIVFF